MRIFQLLLYVLPSVGKLRERQTLGLRIRPFICFVAVVVYLRSLLHGSVILLLICSVDGVWYEGVTICMLLICVYEDIPTAFICSPIRRESNVRFHLAEWGSVRLR